MTGDITMFGSGVGVIFDDASTIEAISDSVSTTSSSTAASSTAVKSAYDLANTALPLSGGTLTGDLTFQNAGDGVIFNDGSSVFSISNSVNTTSSTTAASSTAVKAANDTALAALSKAGGTMTGAITFAAGQTFPGTVSSTLLDVTGDMVFASAPNTPASLPIGANGTILSVNAGLPVWRSAAAAGLLTSSLAATTYAPIDSASLTGQVTINSGGAAGSNALTVTGGNVVLSTSFVPASSASTGTTGEIAWGAGYLYFCYAPNTWGRVQIDLTPF
jgi:hypothetical protein